MYPIFTKRGYGLSNGTDWVIAPKYESLYSFCGGYAYAKSIDGTKYLIDKSAKEINLLDLVRSVCSPSTIDFVGSDYAIDSPGSVVVRTVGEFLVLSLDDKLGLNNIGAFDLNCELAPWYGGDWLLVRVKESGKYRTIISHPDNGTAILNGVEHVDSPYFGCGLLAIKEEGASTWAFYDIAKREVTRDRYYLAQSFSDGLGLVQRAYQSKFEFLDLHLEAVSALQFEWADVFRHGLAAGLKEGVAGYFDVKGVCKFENDGDLRRFNRLGHAIIEYDNGLVGIFDTSGVPQIRNLNSCTFFDGDFPFYHAEQNGKDLVLTGSLKLVSSGGL